MWGNTIIYFIGHHSLQREDVFSGSLSGALFLLIFLSVVLDRRCEREARRRRRACGRKEGPSPSGIQWNSLAVHSLLCSFFQKAPRLLEEAARGGGELALLFAEHLVVLIDDGDGEEYAGAGADGAEEVGDDGEGADAHAAEGGGGWDVAVEDVDDGVVPEALHNHLLIAELLGDVARGRAGDLDPHGGEDGAGGEDEDEVEDGVEGVVGDFGEGPGGRDVVGEASDGDGRVARAFDLLPLADEADEEDAGIPVVEELGEEVEVGDEGRLEDDGHVRRVEELDGVRSLLAAVLLVFDGQIDAPALEVDDDDEDEHRR
mmetsp:Transcript_12501/g.40927  ORF Transcript_12501/g.40927 Transcript_12501/m.40927 type:complete len:317 (-) Transcript_12501:796-1746(-)